MAQQPIINQTETDMAWDDLRTSRAFPAIVGGLAGAGIGIAIMVIASRLTKPKQSLPVAYDGSGNPINVVYLPAQNQFRILGFTIGDIVTLGTIGVTMVRQIQEIQREQALKHAAEADLTTAAAAALPPPPIETPPTAPKKK